MFDTINRWRLSYRQKRLEMEIGLRIRNFIHNVASKVQPIAQVVLPNFRAAHYFYIIFMLILGSIVVYPVRNISYTDTLFITGGAATQAGLNTVDTNKLALYQQIVIYILATLTTPIFIHGSLLFVRLYWFERHFDNIKERSKLNFKMRRSATLAAANTRNSLDSTRLNTVNNQGLGFYDKKPYEDINVVQSSNSTSTHLQQDVEHISEPSDTESEIRLQEERPHIESDADGIRFGNLPHPTKKRARNAEIEPSDMYRSIAMLQDNHKNRHDHRDSTQSPHKLQFSDVRPLRSAGGGNSVRHGDEDDVLIIRPPNEIENDTHNPIFTKRNRRRSSTGKKWTNKLKKSFSNTAPLHHRSAVSIASTMDDEDISIDSENDGDVEDHEDDEDDDEDDDDDDDDEEDDEEDDEDNDSLERAQSHLVIPSTDESGRKFSKRSNTLEITPGGGSTTFGKDTQFKRKKKKRSKRNKLRKALTILSPIFDSNSTRVDDDEEQEYGNEQNSLRKVMSTNYLSWVPTVGRNSTFVHLSDEQKEELGGVEYRAVKLLIKILLIYYIGFHIVGVVLLLPWILTEPQYVAILRGDGFSPVWWAFFTAQLAFNDLGITLTPDSMISFNRSYYVMFVTSFFVVIGNTGFPVLLRFIIWVLFKFSKPLSLFKESLGFLLDHPRRCFTLLFPSVPTWWLFIILVVLNAVDLVLFIILDLNNNYLKVIPVGNRIVVGLFQAFNTRTAGFTGVDLSQLHPAVQVSYMIMMYISVLPLAISIRRTNVYEEQSLGVYLKDDDEEDLEKTPKTFVGAHLRNQLSFDLWYIFLGLFIICIAEGSKLDKQEYRFSVFAILFEIISAYGTVGLSLGYPTINASLSGHFTVLSKLVIIAMMIRGRHRGLPYSLDRAIMLPDDNMARLDKVQENHAVRRNNTIERSNTLARAATFDELPVNLLTRARTRIENVISQRRGSYNQPAPNRRGSSASLRSQNLNQMLSNNTVRNLQPSRDSISEYDLRPAVVADEEHELDNLYNALRATSR